jgi:spore coat polysaccharide biosynthesis protein SpsF
MSSSRFPGKVLAPIDDQPMIVQQLRRVRRASLIGQVVVATSTDPSDDELAEVVKQHGTEVIRGPLNNVAARFVEAVDTYSPEIVVRLTADCPLISPTVIDQVIHEFASKGVDYASNTLQPTYPDGLDVEVLRASALRRLASVNLDSDEREHVTLGIYRRPADFSLHSVVDTSRDESHLRWTVDTEDDLAFVRWVFSQFAQDSHFDYDDILRMLEGNPDRSRTTADGVRNAALLGKDTGAMRGPKE